jgi:purine-nucleoside phosphorylase
MTTITDEELFAHTGDLKGQVVLITGGGNGIGQVRSSHDRLIREFFTEI